MAAFLERLGIFARSPDARPLAEIAADIDDELAFHVEESARALGAEGLDAGSARAEALRRFGDYGRIRRECARTQMGERVMLQRVQLVLTATLVVAVAFMVFTARESRAALEAERAARMELMARLEAQLAYAALPDGRAVVPGPVDRRPAPAATDREPADANAAPGGIDRKPIAQSDGPPGIDRKPVPDAALGALGYAAGYTAPDGSKAQLEDAKQRWLEAFGLEYSSWRHGLKIAGKLAELPGTQGVEILSRCWPRLSVEHREQAMKPFVFDGGHPHALEVLALGIEDSQEQSVRERAATYLETYAFTNLLYGDGRASRWINEWREQPVADVLRKNATRWAGELAEPIRTTAWPTEAQVGDLLSIVDHVRLDTLRRNGVDLSAILAEQGACVWTDSQMQDLSAGTRARAQTVRGWCPP